MFIATKEQIEEWKRKHGEVHSMTVDGKRCYLRLPRRQALGYASISAQNNPLKFSEVLLDECWLAGDGEIKTDDRLFLSVSGKLPELIKTKEAVLEKL